MNWNNEDKIIYYSKNNHACFQSPADDTPPTYDDVVEKLPSYQDALEMSATVSSFTLYILPKVV